MAMKYKLSVLLIILQISLSQSVLFSPVNTLSDLGKALVDSFGDYHRVFWNCQIFAKIFLKKICSTSDTDFLHLTSSEVIQLVAILVLLLMFLGTLLFCRHCSYFHDDCQIRKRQNQGAYQKS
jgi:hypothetical protein